MNCVLEGNAVKAFGKAIHSLSRIGDELCLDPMSKGVSSTYYNWELSHIPQGNYPIFLTLIRGVARNSDLPREEVLKWEA